MITRFLLLALLLVSSANAAAPLSLEETVSLAVANEPGVTAQLDEARALQYQSVSSAQLPDPKLHLGAVNLPTDTFDIDQDPMTQLKVGVEQRFPAGQSREQQHAVYASQADAALSAAEDRRLLVGRDARISWLEIYYGGVAAQTLQNNREVLEQLRLFINSLYRTGRSNQQDITRLELEMSRLSEQEIIIDRDTQAWRARLGQWLGDQAWRPLSTRLPYWSTPMPVDREALARQLVTHPAVVSMDYQVLASRQRVELSRQDYKPEWGVNVSYGHRGSEELNGDTRADLLSAVVSVSMPLFRGSRQDKQVESSLQRSSATLNRRLDLLHRMRGELWSELSRVRQYDRQISLYQEAILAQLEQQADSALRAYQADTGDFSEVMRATLARLNGELDYQRLQIDRLKALAQLRYYLTTTNSTQDAS